MTTPNIEELISSFPEQNTSNFEWNAAQILNEWGIDAAAALQSQAERISGLEKEVAFQIKMKEQHCKRLSDERDELREKYTDTYWALDDAARENTSLRAQLTEIAATEPVAWVRYAENGNIRIWTSASDHSVKLAKETGEPLTPLFTRPMPAQDVTELVDALEKLARLGNGEHYGNSDGNMIARDALSKYKGAK